MLEGAGRIRLPPTLLDGSGMELEIKIKPGNIMFFVETWFKLICMHLYIIVPQCIHKCM